MLCCFVAPPTHRRKGRGAGTGGPADWLGKPTELPRATWEGLNGRAPARMRESWLAALKGALVLLPPGEVLGWLRLAPGPAHLRPAPALLKSQRTLLHSCQRLPWPLAGKGRATGRLTVAGKKAKLGSLMAEVWQLLGKQSRRLRVCVLRCVGRCENFPAHRSLVAKV